MVTIAEDYGVCSLCKKGRLVKKEEKELGGTLYAILECDKCKHKIARSIK